MYQSRCEELEQTIEQLQQRLWRLNPPGSDNEMSERDGEDLDDELNKEELNDELNKNSNNDTEKEKDVNEKENDVHQLASLVNSYKFTNQILVQQVNEWKTKYQKSEEKASESEKNVRRLEEEKQTLLKENEEMRAALSQTDLTDYQFIDDSSSQES